MAHRSTLTHPWDRHHRGECRKEAKHRDAIKASTLNRGADVKTTRTCSISCIKIPYCMTRQCRARHEDCRGGAGNALPGLATKRLMQPCDASSGRVHEMRRFQARRRDSSIANRGNPESSAVLSGREVWVGLPGSPFSALQCLCTSGGWYPPDPVG